METTPRGLAGVIVDATRISEIDGAKGELRYRGYPIAELARAGFVDVAGLVVDGDFPSANDRDEMVRLLRLRELPRAVLAVLKELPRDTHAMTMLQVCLPLLDDRAAKAEAVEASRPAQRRQLFVLAAKIPTLIATWACVQAGTPAPTPSSALPIHADFLRMMRGAEASAQEVALLDALQILQMEHGFNASTFAARVVASTLAPLSTSLSAAVGALSGPLHGGADEAAYRMALAIGAPDKAAAWVDAALARKEKIMGLGHREYRVVDPRAVVLRELAARSGGAALATLAAVDDHASARFADEGKTIRANVEFYKGAVFAGLGVAPEYFTALFVMARIYGWGAHILELWDDNKLYRPGAKYVGSAARSVHNAA